MNDPNRASVEGTPTPVLKASLDQLGLWIGLHDPSVQPDPVVIQRWTVADLVSVRDRLAARFGIDWQHATLGTIADHVLADWWHVVVSRPHVRRRGVRFRDLSGKLHAAPPMVEPEITFVLAPVAVWRLSLSTLTPRQ